MISFDFSHYDTEVAQDLLSQQLKKQSLSKHCLRFAPSPTGYFHLGNIYSAFYTQSVAQKLNAKHILRVEDIDPARYRGEYEDSFYDDFEWLELNYDLNVRKQSQHIDMYRKKIDDLVACGVAYPCFCSRQDVRRALQDRQTSLIDIELDNKESTSGFSSSPEHQDYSRKSGPEGLHYPETCKGLCHAEIEQRKSGGQPYSLRLNIQAALKYLAREHSIELNDLAWFDLRAGWQDAQPHLLGDVIIARKDCGTSYHASVVLDDALQDITLITRGVDLFYMTHIHRLLQALWGLPAPLYDHHALLVATDGGALSKTLRSESIEFKKQAGATKADIFFDINQMARTYDMLSKASFVT